MQRAGKTKKVAKKRTTISIAVEAWTTGVKLAVMEKRDFSGMLENAIEERWAARHKEAKAA